MVNQQLVTYLQTELQKGVDPQVIRNTLMAKDWQTADIDAAFTYLPQTQSSNLARQKDTSSVSQTNVNQPAKIIISDSLNSDQNNKLDNSSIYPIISIDCISNPSRFYALPILGWIIKLIFLFPVLIELYIVSLVIFPLLLINSFVILFTGRYWSIAYRFCQGYMRLILKINFFLYGLTNKYPGFAFSINDSYSLEMPYPETSNRLLNFPLFGIFIKNILLIPFSIYTAIISYGAIVGYLIASLSTLFLGKYPESIFELVRDTARLVQSAVAYNFGLSDRYPNFSISMNHKVAKLCLILSGIIFFIVISVLPIIFNINVPQQSLQAQNAQRRQGVSNISRYLNTYMIDNKGNLPDGITSIDQEISKQDTDICSILIPKYTQELPSDPLVNKGRPIRLCSSDYKTGYHVQITNTRQVIISAPLASGTEKISSSFASQSVREQKNPVPTLPPSVTPLRSNATDSAVASNSALNNQNYTNTKGGYSYSYPQGWKNTESIYQGWNSVEKKDEMTTSSLLINNSDSSIVLGIRFETTGGTCTSREQSVTTGQQLKTTQTSLSGIPTTIYEGQVGPSSYAFYNKYIFVAKGQYCYDIFIQDQPANPWKSTFDQILTSFKSL